MSYTAPSVTYQILLEWSRQTICPSYSNSSLCCLYSTDHGSVASDCCSSNILGGENVHNILQNLANKSMQNHFSVRKHNAAMTIKMFALQGVVAYGALTLSAFVYIPFGQAIMDAIVHRGFFESSILHAEQRGDLKRNATGSVIFDINPSRMHAQLFAVLTTSQAINAFTEVGLPYITRKAHEFMQARKEKQEKQPTSEKAKEQTPEDDILTHIEEELEKPAYDTFGDYAEMSTQFGYIVLWSTIWPLAPVMGFVNNFFELRSDALKIAVHERRPVPMRAESIGPWLDVLVSFQKCEVRNIHSGPI